MAPGGRYLAHFAESLDAPAVAARMTDLMQGDTP
jgi:protein SCO1/2